MSFGKNRLILLLIFLILLLASLLLLSRSSINNQSNSFVDSVKEKLNIEEKNIEIVMVGDVMLGRNVMITSLDKNDPIYPFRKVGEVLAKADLTLANLENPIIKNCPRINSGFTFCADPKMVEGLIFAGIDVVNLANNHSLNFGRKGFEETKKILADENIKWVGDGNLEIVEKEGLSFGFVGFDKSQQTNPKLSPEEEKLVQVADSKVDVLVVSMHWGVEYQDEALPGVRSLARRLVELGADVVHGHHPHWVQDIEYCDKNGRCEPSTPSRWTGLTPSENMTPIYYSLGNFVFDQMWSEGTRKGLAVRLVFDKERNLKKEEKLPIYMKDWAQPEFVR